MQEIIIGIIEKVTGEEVDKQAVLHSHNLINDLGINSLNLMELIVELENNFKVEFNLDKIELNTFDSLDALQSHLRGLLENVADGRTVPNG